MDAPQKLDGLFLHEQAVVRAPSATAGFVDIAVVIPVYNGKDTIAELVDRLVKSLTPITADYAIVLIDDRSPDNCWPLILELGEKNPRVHGIQLSRNFGQHRALTAGIDFVRARWYVVMDCDLQDAPEDIEILLRKALDGHDVVVATRDKKGHHFVKRSSSRPFYWLFNFMSGLTLDWSVGNFRVFSDAVAETYRRLREEERFLPAAFSWMGFDVGVVQLDHHERGGGRSSYSVRKLLKLAAGVIFSYSELPLWIVATFGFVMSLISICLAAIYVLKALIAGSPVVGWTSLMVGIFVLGSIQILMLGVVGIYVGKTFREAQQRPLYVVRALSGFRDEKPDQA